MTSTGEENHTHTHTHVPSCIYSMVSYMFVERALLVPVCVCVRVGHFQCPTECHSLELIRVVDSTRFGSDQTPNSNISTHREHTCLHQSLHLCCLLCMYVFFPNQCARGQSQSARVNADDWKKRTHTTTAQKGTTKAHDNKRGTHTGMNRYGTLYLWVLVRNVVVLGLYGTVSF